MKKIKKKILYLAKILWIIYEIVKLLIDKTIEIALLYKNTIKGKKLSSEKLRYFYKDYEKKIHDIINSRFDIVVKFYSKYLELADYLYRYEYNDAKILE